MNLYLDTETYSEEDITLGVSKYISHLSTELLLLGYQLGHNSPIVIDFANKEVLSDDFLTALADPTTVIYAHNVAFDYAVISHFIMPTPRERWRCTMLMARALSLPSALGSLTALFSLHREESKEEGRKLVLKFSKPAPKSHKLGRYTQTTSSSEWGRFKQYLIDDVKTLSPLVAALEPLTVAAFEQDLILLNDKINERGILLDTALLERLMEVCERIQQELNTTLSELTQGKVMASTQIAKFKTYLNTTYNLGLVDLAAATVETLLSKEEVPAPAKRVLLIRQQAGLTSASKAKAMLERCGLDGRARDNLSFRGASRTGRWASHGVNMQNLPRQTLSQEEIEGAISALFIHGQVSLKQVSQCLRSAIIAPEGKQLVISDLSAIEGRVLAWLAGDKDKLDRFLTADKGKGFGVYEQTAADILGKDPNHISKEERQVFGKVPELALGYQGGVGAFAAMAKNYGIVLEDYWEAYKDKITPIIFRMRIEEDYGLSEKAWRMCESIKARWREANKPITQLWQLLQDTGVDLWRNHGGYALIKDHLAMFFKDKNLYLLMPSGNFIQYANYAPEEKGNFFDGVNSITRKLERQCAFGGRLAENVTQALSRDILGYGMLAAEQAGFEIVMTVHDEVIAEVSLDRTHQQLSDCLSQPIPWAEGLPLKAEGFSGKRYFKS